MVVGGDDDGTATVTVHTLNEHRLSLREHNRRLITSQMCELCGHIYVF